MRGLIGPNGAGKTTPGQSHHRPLSRRTAATYASKASVSLGLKPYQIARRGLVRSFQVCRLFGNCRCSRICCCRTWRSRAQAASISRRGKCGVASSCELVKLAPARGRAGQEVFRADSVPAAGRCRVHDAGTQMLRARRAVRRDQSDHQGFDRRARSWRRTARAASRPSSSSAMRWRSCDGCCRRVTVMVEGRVAAEGTLDEVAARGDVLAAYLGRGWT